MLLHLLTRAPPFGRQAALPVEQAASARSPAADDAARYGTPEEAGLPPLPCSALQHKAGSRHSARAAERVVATPQRSDRCQIPDCASPSLAHLRPYNRRTRRVLHACCQIASP